MRRFKKKSKKLNIVLLLLVICFHCCSILIYAGQTTGTLPESGSVKAEYVHGTQKEALADMKVSLYLVADMDMKKKPVEFSMKDAFAGCVKEIKPEQNYTSTEWGTISEKLAKHVEQKSIDSISSGKTNAKGIVTFTDLKQGLYLLIAEGTENYEASPVLLSVPYDLIEVTGRNEWMYDVTVCAKVEERKPVPPIPEEPDDPEPTEEPDDPEPTEDPDDPEPPDEPQPPVDPENPRTPEGLPVPIIPPSIIMPETPVPAGVPIPPANTPRRPNTQQETPTIVDEGEPEAAPQTVRIGDAEVPLFADDGAAWALVNFMLMNLAVFLSLMLLIGYFVTTKKEKEEEEKAEKQEVQEDEEAREEEEEPLKLKKKGLLRLLSLPVAVISVIAFLLTEDISLPTALLDKWTPLMLFFVLVQMVWVVFSRKKYVNEEEEEEEGDELE